MRDRSSRPGVPLSVLAMLAIAATSVALGQGGLRGAADVPVLSDHVLVDWPRPPLSEAGVPAGPWNFIEVASVAIDRRGHVLVLRRGAPPILEFDPHGTFVRAWGSGLFSEGKAVLIPPALRVPARSSYSAIYGAAGCDSCGAHSIRLDPLGNLWTVDAAGHSVYRMNPQGKVTMRLGKRGLSGSGPDRFYLPTDVAFAPDGTFYVSDGYGNARVVKYSREGKYLLEFGKRGTGPGEFMLPHNLVVDARGRIYVTDRDNARVEVFEPDGTFVKEWKTGSGASALFMTKDQHIWAGGVRYDLDGQALGRLEYSPRAGAIHGVAASEAGEVYLAHLGGGVLKFERTKK